LVNKLALPAIHHPRPPPVEMSQETSECSSQEVPDSIRIAKRQKKEAGKCENALSIATALRAARPSDLKRAAKELGDCEQSKVLVQQLAEQLSSRTPESGLEDGDLVQFVHSSISKTISSSGQKRLRTDMEAGTLSMAQLPYQLRAALNRKFQLSLGNSCVDYHTDCECCNDGVYQFKMGTLGDTVDWVEECYLAVLEQLAERECIPNREDAGLDDNDDVDLFDRFGIDGKDQLLQDAYEWRMANEDPAALLEQLNEDVDDFLFGKGWCDERDYSKHTQEVRVDFRQAWVRKPKVRLVIDDLLVC
jgi:hypothetical protein